MTGTGDESELLIKIQNTYVPFLKKLIAYLEKNNKTSPENINKLKAIYAVFTTAPAQEQIETFHANEKKLEHWYNKTQKEKDRDGGKRKKNKRPAPSSDTESSQGGFEVPQPISKKSCTISNSVISESSRDISQYSSVTDQLVPVTTNNSVNSSGVIQPLETNAANANVTEVQSEQVLSKDDQIIFTCASCQFQTHDETEYIKHARANHKTDLSLWCKECGKCFSNAGILVTHIKERACSKEEMIYKCGAKDCTFLTTIGQTFVHHLRHCHKRSPFIFCVHCQKIFTLPHCLILHMQDDCPYKERNRKNFDGVSVDDQQLKDPNPLIVNALAQPKDISNQIATSPYNVAKSVVQPSIVQAPIVIASTSRGRRFARGRGRWKSRSQISDSSDSDDPDDPSWLIDDSSSGMTLRRSARWAKKLNDVMNPESPPPGGSSSHTKMSFTSAELNTEMISCPCCDFMAAFQSVLEDHYIANHKIPNKNSCLVCHLKFEDTQSFLDHFEVHRKGVLPCQSSSELVPQLEPQIQPMESKQSEETERDCPKTNISTAVSLSEVISAVSEEKESFDGVLISIAETDFTSPIVKDTAITVPYQATIHNKNLSHSKLKKFEAFKSPKDLIILKTIPKLKDFFRCSLYNCDFTTDVSIEFASHLKNHDSKSYHCCYCLKEESNISMTEHIVSTHHKLIYQCNKCFYRGCSKAHVQIHIKNYHVFDSYTDVLVCNAQELLDNVPQETEPGPEDLNTIWPYVCAIGQCDFRTYDPKEFKKHNETVHITTTVFYCHYCKVDFLLFKRLMNHYRLHGLNLFQCNYCIHGTETKEEILIHLCNVHADQPLKAYMRGSKEEVLSEVKELNTVMNEELKGLSLEEISSAKKDVSVENPSKNARKDIAYTGCENELYHVIDNKCYPKHLQSVCFPRYLQNLLSDVICGIPFCNEKFQDIHVYLSHLRNVHDALNFACPHCPEMCDLWEDFKNHLLCHSSKLYACGSRECEFYDWNKDKVNDHKKVHQESDCSVFSVRDSTPTNDEYKLHFLSHNTEFPELKKNFVCSFCNYKSGNQNTMKNHMYREMAYQRFDCSLCERKCVSRKDIKDHFVTSHPDSDILSSVDYNSEIEAVVKLILTEHHILQDVKLTELCDMCCRKFQNLKQLQCHLYICLQKKYRPYECQHCKKYFVNLRALKYHTDKEHYQKNVEYTFTPNYAIEDDIEKNLLKVRLKHLKDLLEEKKLHIDSDDKTCKIYHCSDCTFEAHHKFNVQRHNEENHKGLASIKKSHESNLQADENSNDGTTFKNLAKRYCCGYCIKKMITIHEVEKHMRKVHNVKKDYFYYYSPDVSKPFSATDNKVYECAYCKSSKDNLFLLKKHADLIHSEMEFKVKGYVLCIQPKNNYLACGYCYHRLDNQGELQEHSASSHPSLPLNTVGDIQGKKKHANQSPNDFSNKRVKFKSTVFVCSHCNGAFMSMEHITLHSKKSHSRLKLEFTKMDPSSNFKFYKCEFCQFTAEKPFLDKHLASKHKMRVTCSYCTRRFEFASKLKEHHEVHHKNLPIKYNQETVHTNKKESSNFNEAPSDKIKIDTTIPKLLSYYGRNPETVDLNSLTVHMEVEGQQARDVPFSYITKHFNISPKVVLEDIMKRKLDNL